MAAPRGRDYHLTLWKLAHALVKRNAHDLHLLRGERIFLRNFFFFLTQIRSEFLLISTVVLDVYADVRTKWRELLTDLNEFLNIEFHKNRATRAILHKITFVFRRYQLIAHNSLHSCTKRRRCN